MKLEVPDFQSDERGVSPVIGVILMVAITVILAAVIGAFVLDLGSQLGSTGPTSQLSVSDSSDSLEAATGTADDIVGISHKGGDDLKSSDLKLLIKQDGTTYYTDDSLADGTAITETNSPAADLSWKTAPPSSEITVGDSLTIKEAAADDFPAGTWTVQIVHKPSNSIIVNSQVDVS